MAEPPTSEPPPSSGPGYAIRRRLRRLWYRVQDAGIALARLPKLGIAKFRQWWMGRSASTRRYVALGAGAVLALIVIWLLIVPALPCGLPGGGSCPPDDDAAALVPSDALLYVHANTDPDTDQYEEAASLAGELPTLSSQLVANLPGAEGAGIYY